MLQPSIVSSIRPIIRVKRTGVTKVGRDQNNVDYYINTETATNVVSRVHAELFYREDGKCCITDKSMNGIAINGIRQSGTTVLEDGDQIIFGCGTDWKLGAPNTVPGATIELVYTFHTEQLPALLQSQSVLLVQSPPSSIADTMPSSTSDADVRRSTKRQLSDMAEESLFSPTSPPPRVSLASPSFHLPTETQMRPIASPPHDLLGGSVQSLSLRSFNLTNPSPSFNDLPQPPSLFSPSMATASGYASAPLHNPSWSSALSNGAALSSTSAASPLSHKRTRFDDSIINSPEHLAGPSAMLLDSTRPLSIDLTADDDVVVVGAAARQPNHNVEDDDDVVEIVHPESVRSSATTPPTTVTSDGSSSKAASVTASSASSAAIAAQEDDSMEAELECTICSDVIKGAHALGCSHTFCKGCIIGWLTMASNITKTCPVCRAPIEVAPHPVRPLDAILEKHASRKLSVGEFAEWKEARDKEAKIGMPPFGRHPQQRPHGNIRENIREMLWGAHGQVQLRGGHLAVQPNPHAFALQNQFLNMAVARQVIEDRAGGRQNRRRHQIPPPAPMFQLDVPAIPVHARPNGLAIAPPNAIISVLKQTGNSNRQCRQCLTRIANRTLYWSISSEGDVSYNDFYHFACFQPAPNVAAEDVNMASLTAAERHSVGERLRRAS